MKAPLLIGLVLGVWCTQASARADDSRLAEGIASYQAGAYAEAENTFRQAISPPANNEARFHLGRALMAQGHWAEAVTVLEEAVDGAPDNARSNRLLGEALGRYAEVASVLKRLGLAKRGLTYFESAVALAPHDLEARDSLMEYYLQAPGFAGGGEGKAMAQAEEVKAFHPSEGFRLLGRIHHHKKRYKQARTAYERAIVLDPSHRLAYLGLARLAIDRRQWTVAFHALDVLLTLEPDHPPGLYELGRAAAGSGGRTEDGIRALRTYADRPRPAAEPARTDALLILARLLSERGDHAAARRALDRLLALDPAHRQAKRQRSRLP